MVEIQLENLTHAELDRLRAVYEPLARSVRQLIDATIRTEMDADAVTAATAQIDAVTARLRTRQIDGSFGVRYTTAGAPMAWGDAVCGVRNPIAPPLVTERDGDRVFSEFELGAAYEGPTGHVHGGVCAMVLDHLLGEVAADSDKPRFTGTLTVRYRRPTPLGALRAEAWIDRIDGPKAFAAGHILAGQQVTAEAEGVFILPKWARG
ncbi:PaaI family thioesterase [Mycolicibacterium thermoresistibile]|uniref:Acyl-coenzyme A thioesterase THEM4 n=1 Tax=Mycolicibacterium thermoresistibile TaxID=1797 RepID=A0A100XB51_MYCTH|nr:PaaI family thioesterase [Mycolicibacterium thermoresistibile]GAT13354.1 thioesterase superfamily protein [Mycolicibacterium thermoresistibile]SNW18471.1 thioesterase superfamily protein [Mycolicibacterium thermoresistibile]